MKVIMIKIMMTISTLITMLKTPMSMGIMLLMQTIMATILMSMTTKSSWMSMIMFLMFVGGLLILFMYMSSIASNEKFSPNIKAIMIMIIIMIPTEEMLMEMQMQDSLSYITANEKLVLLKIFNKKTFVVTIMMFMYMFLTMIVVTKIIKIHSGPLRSSKYE